MGADGGIVIYDWDKVKQKFDEEILESFLGHCSDSTLYLQKLQNREYMTRYRGDNLHCYKFLFDTICYAYDPKADTFDKEACGYDNHFADYLNKLHVEQRQYLKAVVDYLQSECRLAYWEVWT